MVATARTIKFSARLLDLSPQTLAKGIRAGVIPEITAGNLSALAAIPVLTRARTDDGFAALTESWPAVTATCAAAASRTAR